MAALTRFGPLRAPVHLDPFARDLDEIFKGFFFAPGHLAEEVQGHIPVNLSEDDKSFTLRAELPGYRKEDIRVDVRGDTLTLAAEVQGREERKEGTNAVIRECWYGRQFRTLKLPQAVDEARVRASYADGVLQLNLPKLAAAEKRAIVID